MFPICVDNDPLSSFDARSTYCKDDMLKIVKGKEPLNLFELILKLCKLTSHPISSGILPALFSLHLSQVMKLLNPTQNFTRNYLVCVHFNLFIFYKEREKREL